jgi:hypothetical protein
VKEIQLVHHCECVIVQMDDERETTVKVKVKADGVVIS